MERPVRAFAPQKGHPPIDTPQSGAGTWQLATYIVPTTGIPRSGLVSSLRVGSCFNPTFKSENSDITLRRSLVWIQHRFVCSISTYVELHMSTAYMCWLTKNIDQKLRSLRSNVAILLRLECRSSAKVKFHNGRLSQKVI